MTDQQMEDLVERIIQRLRPPVLVMVTAAAGYRQAIRQRLAGCGESLHLALESGIDDGERQLTFDEVVVRVRDDFALEFHIDTEEANAAGLKNGAQVRLHG